MIAFLLLSVWPGIFDNPLPIPLPDFPDPPDSGSFDFSSLLPDIDFSTDWEIDLPEIEHGENFDEWSDFVTGFLAGISAPFTSLQDSLDMWIGGGGEVPSGESGDLDINLAPLTDEDMSAVDFAADAGTKIATIFDYIRALREIDTSGVGLFFTFIFVCIALLIFLYILKFAVQVFQALWAKITEGIDLVRNFWPL